MREINFIKLRPIFFGFSIVLTLASIAVMLTFGFKPGIDFAGGTSLEVRVDEVNTAALPAGQSVDTYLVESFKKATGEETIAQRTGDNQFSLRSKTITNDQKNAFEKEIATTIPKLTELRFESVSPTIGTEAVRRAGLAVVLAIIVIMLYLAYAFRRVPKPTSSWRFGAAAIIALAHDVIILLGVYAVLGKLYGAEVDSMFITAALTMLGFSVHDTIVTFDRLRENLITKGPDNFAHKLNDSIVETVVRSINTSFTLVLVLLALVLLGGNSIFFFSLALLIGVIFGTYSSIFIASMLLLTWQERAAKTA